MKAIVINGSPRMEKGNTAFILAPFIEGMQEAGCEVNLFYASAPNIKPCNCSIMYCWTKNPGECCIKDDMQMLYPLLREADILILATPVYIPLPGDMQNFINRLCPLLDPVLKFEDGRTRARFRENVNIKKIALVSASGWWELGNFDVVVHIVKELAKNANAEFAGAVLRPHAYFMKSKAISDADKKEVLDALKKAGSELVSEGKMHKKTLESISRPLISEKEILQIYNS
ncbi:MAG: flavodoxin family protein [Kosmotoga sp.]|uniref:flavodoxin family protein n=1 Tax=Kosmotoga sp. TaxID=1955248 RepID=UPI001D8B5C82|nr:flavodoxin family protein [Kosmotoga sp.]MBO8167493.1 flavodoxin family protein [Kosmotoga sp.]